MNRLFLPSIGRSRALLLFFISKFLNLWITRIGVYSISCMLRSMQDNFVWGLIGIFGPNDDML